MATCGNSIRKNDTLRKCTENKANNAVECFKTSSARAIVPSACLTALGIKPLRIQTANGGYATDKRTN